MRDVTGVGCNKRGAPVRSDLPLHDMTGGNTFIPTLIEAAFPGESDPAALNAGIQRATEMLQKAARLGAIIPAWGVFSSPKTVFGAYTVPAAITATEE